MKKRFYNKIISALCAAALLVSALPAALAAEPSTAELRQSGSISLPKLSQEEITQLLYQSPISLSDPVLVEEPSIRVPYETGAVSQEALQAATGRLNLLACRK